MLNNAPSIDDFCCSLVILIEAKAASEEPEDDEEADAKPPPKKKGKGKAVTMNGSASASQAVSQSAPSNNGVKPDPDVDFKSKTDFVEVENNIAQSKDIDIQIDEGCPLSHYRVYIDEKGLIYDASLNQTNSSNNNNKFYRLQVSRMYFP